MSGTIEREPQTTADAQSASATAETEKKCRGRGTTDASTSLAAFSTKQHEEAFKQQTTAVAELDSEISTLLETDQSLRELLGTGGVEKLTHSVALPTKLGQSISSHTIPLVSLTSGTHVAHSSQTPLTTEQKSGKQDIPAKNTTEAELDDSAAKECTTPKLVSRRSEPILQKMGVHSLDNNTKNTVAALGHGPPPLPKPYASTARSGSGSHPSPPLSPSLHQATTPPNTHLPSEGGPPAIPKPYTSTQPGSARPSSGSHEPPQSPPVSPSPFRTALPNILSRNVAAIKSTMQDAIPSAAIQSSLAAALISISSGTSTLFTPTQTPPPPPPPPPPPSGSISPVPRTSFVKLSTISFAVPDVHMQNVVPNNNHAPLSSPSSITSMVSAGSRGASTVDLFQNNASPLGSHDNTRVDVLGSTTSLLTDATQQICPDSSEVSAPELQELCNKTPSLAPTNAETHNTETNENATGETHSVSCSHDEHTPSQMPRPKLPTCIPWPENVEFQGVIRGCEMRIQALKHEISVLENIFR